MDLHEYPWISNPAPKIKGCNKKAYLLLLMMKRKSLTWRLLMDKNHCLHFQSHSPFSLDF